MGLVTNLKYITKVKYNPREHDLTTMKGRIEHNRELKNISRDEVTKLLNISKKEYSRVINSTNCKLNTYLKICDVLKVDYKYILDDYYLFFSIRVWTSHKRL